MVLVASVRNYLSYFNTKSLFKTEHENKQKTAHVDVVPVGVFNFGWMSSAQQSSAFLDLGLQISIG